MIKINAVTTYHNRLPINVRPVPVERKFVRWETKYAFTFLIFDLNFFFKLYRWINNFWLLKISVETTMSPFEGLDISNDWQELFNINERQPCNKCFKSRKYFCYTCYTVNADLEKIIPRLKVSSLLCSIFK